MLGAPDRVRRSTLLQYSTISVPRDLAMTRHFRDLGLLSVCLAGLVLNSGCDGSEGDDVNAPPAPQNVGGGSLDPGPPGGPGGDPAKGGRSSPIRTIMM